MSAIDELILRWSETGIGFAAGAMTEVRDRLAALETAREAHHQRLCKLEQDYADHGELLIELYHPDHPVVEQATAPIELVKCQCGHSAPRWYTVSCTVCGLETEPFATCAEAVEAWIAMQSAPVAAPAYTALIEEYKEVAKTDNGEYAAEARNTSICSPVAPVEKSCDCDPDARVRELEKTIEWRDTRIQVLEQAITSMTPVVQRVGELIAHHSDLKLQNLYKAYKEGVK